MPLSPTLQTWMNRQKIIALNGLARRVIGPYIVMTIVLFLMGIGVRLAPLPEVEAEDEEEQDSGAVTKKNNIFGFPHLILGVVALFLYVGAEVIAGDTIIRYGLSLGIELEKAKAFTSYTMATMVIGYLIGIALIPKVITQSYALKVSAILGILFSFGSIFTSGFTSVIFVAMFGLSNAIVWPAIWPLAIHNLGKFIKTGSALLIMAIAGGAIMPLLWGKISDNFGSQEAYWLMVPAYIFILFYAIRGHKIKSWT